MLVDVPRRLRDDAIFSSAGDPAKRPLPRERLEPQEQSIWAIGEDDEDADDDEQTMMKVDLLFPSPRNAISVCPQSKQIAPFES